jgi:hypothetical protein
MHFIEAWSVETDMKFKHLHFIIHILVRKQFIVSRKCSQAESFTAVCGEQKNVKSRLLHKILVK